MNVTFIPIPPDTASSLREEVMEAAEERDLEGYIERCGAFTNVVSASLPDTPEARSLMDEMKRNCTVRITL